MKNILHPLFFFLATCAFSQTNVRAWYAEGQVFVVWENTAPLPETYAIYARPTTFSNTANAVLVGRLFKEEYLPAALREQVDTAATYRIPAAGGLGGFYQLAPNEGLFVATPHQAGSLFFAVVPWGTTNVSAGKNITSTAVPFAYDPAGDPVECHLQKTFVSPFDPNSICFAFYMWADGRQNQWENRPDFPVMANAAKNGMPSLFLISAPIGLDTTGGIPLTVWLHGGGGTARQSLAGSRMEIRLNPKKGILLAHNDDLFGKLLSFYSGFESVSKHFGWRKNYDPFTGEAPTAPDTIVNYTQRRYRWIDEWLIKNYHVDRNRININGHSMGSRGATMMAKAFPDHYASATILNNSFIDDDPPSLSDVAFGPSSPSFPTNLKGHDGETIHFSSAINLTTRLSSARDFPLMRSFHGKNDTGGSNAWGDHVVEQYRAADSLGWGAQLFWSERSHGPDTGPPMDDHWLNGIPVNQQTIVDDVAYEEENLRSDVSYPAFFNHRLDAQNHDPGDGTPGTGAAGVGDDWGTWGGYHRWDWNNITDQPGVWSAVAWLESNAVFANDNCPVNSLTADVAIRKPRFFKPLIGKSLKWNVKDVATGNVLQSGTTLVKTEDVVVVPQVKVYRESNRKVRISVLDPTISTEEPTKDRTLLVSPNPTNAWIKLPENTAQVQVFDLNGKTVLEKRAIDNPALDVSALPKGLYILKIFMPDGWQPAGRFVKN